MENSLEIEMEKLIISSYKDGNPASGDGITEFIKNHGGYKKLYPTWKKLEKKLFDQGKISHIELPYNG
jgi:hypothetical protein